MENIRISYTLKTIKRKDFSQKFLRKFVGVIIKNTNLKKILTLPFIAPKIEQSLILREKTTALDD
ncbi:MAG TPA: hypothetical protein VF556_18210 [Pyrinomonadaceae bacterium]|jgi:hypothetical protein